MHHIIAFISLVACPRLHNVAIYAAAVCSIQSMPILANNCLFT